MRDDNDLHQDVLDLLAPITRDRYTYTGTSRTVERVNPAGIDLHDGSIGSLALAPDGTARPYMGLVIHPRTDRHTRISGGSARGYFGFSLTVAAGSPRGARAAIVAVTAHLARARLHESTGLLTPYLDQIHLVEDTTASPTRWYAPMRWSVTVH